MIDISTGLVNEGGNGIFLVFKMCDEETATKIRENFPVLERGYI